MTDQRLEVQQAADTTRFVGVTQQAMYDPDGFIDGYITIDFNKWVTHANKQELSISITFNEARKLKAILGQRLAELDTQLYVMKERRRRVVEIEQSTNDSD